MSFMKETAVGVMDIWEQCEKTDFIMELKKGTLPASKFKNYIIQDSIYLKHYARVCGKAIYLSTNLRDIQLYYAMLGFVTDKESAVRLKYLHSYGLTDDDVELMEPLPENRTYIEFLLAAAERGGVCEILMAALPCMMLYSWLFRRIAAEPGTDKSRYWDFIEDYADQQYEEQCIVWGQFAERRCGGLPESEKTRLAGIFREASGLELAFWHMAYSI